VTAHGASRTIGSWGGRRKGAGRKRKLTLSSRRKIAGNYFAGMQKRQNNRRLREALIGKLMAKYKVTHRMVVRCVAEFLPDFRWNAKMYNYAIEGAKRIQPLPARNINKRAFKPGVYVENKLRRKLRLIVDSTGRRTWIFPFCWGTTIHHMVLGGQEISLTKARELATKASRKLAAGQNPINDSWASAALQSTKSKT
jgi:Arm DNA-binding domain